MPQNKVWRVKWDLFLINAFSLLLVGVILLNQAGMAWLHYVRVGLALPMVLFSPGYALIAAWFTGRRILDGIERFALSFGLSLAVVPLVGLGLNYTPWGIRLTPIIVSLVTFTFLLSVIAFFRRRKLPAGQVYYPVFQLQLPRWSELGRRDRFLSVVLVLAVLFAVGSAVYTVILPKTGESFTEFYILGPNGKVTDYPRNMDAGQPGKVIAGVVNHEHVQVTYFVEVMADGTLKERTGPFQLADGQKWEQGMSFTIYKPQAKVKVEFLLFRQGDAAPYHTLYLWVNVAPMAVPGPSAAPAAPGGGNGGVSRPAAAAGRRRLPG